MRDLLLPRTDSGVLIQLAVVGGALATALLAVWRHRDVRLLVTGLGLLALGALGVRALH